MNVKVIGTSKNKPTITVEFYEDGISLVHLEGTKPFIRRGLTPEKAESIMRNANYFVKIEKPIDN